MLASAGISYGPVSVCLSVHPSVISRCSTVTSKCSITQTTRLVFSCRKSPQNATGITSNGGLNTGGVGKMQVRQWDTSRASIRTAPTPITR